QKAILSFDALPEIKFVGKVIERDTIGKVEQGVVSFNLKILLEGEDERVKPGMSVSAEIITQTKKDVLVLLSSAIKSQNDIYYVEWVNVPAGKKEEYLRNPPSNLLTERREIKVGISNETETEIVSGLEEGDIVVLSIISNKIPRTNTSRQSQFQIPGFGGGGMPRR
ncbi:MAG: efflux RND transporter periplasmic adaptor subunit, partial [Minisyncoccales bacterium]